MEDLLIGKGIYRAGKGKGKIVLRAGEGVLRAGPLHCKIIIMWIFNTASSLTNFEIQKYYKNELRFNGVYSRDNLAKIKDGAYVINLDEYSDIVSHWVALYVQIIMFFISILLV